MTALTISNTEIRQLDDLYSLNDLHKAAGGDKAKQPALFMRNDQTQALVAELSSTDSQIIHSKTILGKGKQQGTYVCRELVYAYANWISAAFYLKMIRAFDALHAVPPVPELPHLITPAQAGELATLIAERFPDGRQRPYAWGRFNNHFRISGYKTLPAARFEEACAYIPTMPDKGKALPPPPSSPSIVPAEGMPFSGTLRPDGTYAIYATPRDYHINLLTELLAKDGYVLTKNEVDPIKRMDKALADLAAARLALNHSERTAA